MADGTTRPIAEVEVGDEVAAFNPETEEIEPRRVTDTFVHEGVATVRVTTTAGEITSTINHPFYVEGKGWLALGELEQDDRLRAPEGQPVEVVSIQATGRSETVHNLAGRRPAQLPRVECRHRCPRTQQHTVGDAWGR